MKRRLPEWIETRIVEMETLDGLRFDYAPAKNRLSEDVSDKRSNKPKTDPRGRE